MPARALAAGVAIAAVLGCASCEKNLVEPRPLPAELDAAFFRCRVQPVLAGSCAAFACHGDGKRFFRVFARNRLRLEGPEAKRNAPLSDAEVTANFDAARAMLDADDADRSFLLMKPLDQTAGGWFHRGAEIFGRGDVFTTRDDPRYVTLVAWTQGAKEEPSCIEPGSDQ